MKGKSKKSIIILIVLLAIGFAAVTTTLTINGVIKIGANQENFKKGVQFVNGAHLVYSDEEGHTEEDHGSVTIGEGNTSISFETGKLKNLGEKVTLYYQIKNESQYYAKLNNLKCTLTRTGEDNINGNSSSTVTAEYVKLTAQSINNIVLDPKGDDAANITNEHTVEIDFTKSFVGDADSDTSSYNVTCTIDVDGLSDRPADATTEKATEHTTEVE